MSLVIEQYYDAALALPPTVLAERVQATLSIVRHVIAPAEGWERFPSTDSLLETIHTALPLRGSGGLWRYYNFTSTSSIWDADLPLRNCLSIDFRDVSSKQIAELAVEATPTEHPCHLQLRALLERLAIEYRVVQR